MLTFARCLQFVLFLILMFTMSSVSFQDFALKCRKIIGAGLNYKKILKQRNLLAPKEPVIFLKPPSSIITEKQTIEIPETFEVHHEVELGVIIGKKCKKVHKYDALDCVAGYCLALDLTDVKDMKTARENGLPWTIGKGFDTSCPVSVFIPKHEISDPNDVPLWLNVNNENRQKSYTGDMVFKTEELISYISQYMTLEPYDLILTAFVLNGCLRYSNYLWFKFQPNPLSGLNYLRNADRSVSHIFFIYYSCFTRAKYQELKKTIPPARPP